jgi:hypothetical protein
MKIVYLVTIILSIATRLASAQNKQQVNSGDYLKTENPAFYNQLFDHHM